MTATPIATSTATPTATTSSIAAATTLASPVTSGVLQGVARLPHLGVIKVQGADAATFLQGQLTQDVLTMQPGESRLAGFCSAKGRLQASFQVLRCQGAAGQEGGPALFGDAEFLLVCSQDILAATCKRLSMFVMRAKCRLTDASADFPLYGLLGDAVESAAAKSSFLKPDGQTDSQALIHLPSVDGVKQAICVTAAAAPAPTGGALVLEHWLWAEVRSGVPRVTSATVDAFVPQMLNYESIGGVNFKKGCYPGQEVVARSQFRGTLKRRAYVAHGDAAMAPGQEVFSALDDGQPCGSVVLAAGAPDGGFDVIVSIQVAAAQAGGLTVAASPKVALQLLGLPYALLEDI